MNRLILNEKFSEAELVLTYVSIGPEVSTRELITYALECGKRVAVPKCESGGIMHFHEIKSLDDLTDGRFDIPEPCEGCLAAEITENTVCIVPGMAFTPDGNRLGYGGGFYDRFLSANKGIYTIALGYDELITPALHCEEHDIRVNAIITEKRLVVCSAE